MLNVNSAMFGFNITVAQVQNLRCCVLLEGMSYGLFRFLASSDFRLSFQFYPKNPARICVQTLLRTQIREL